MSYKESHKELRKWLHIRNSLRVGSPEFKEAQDKVINISGELKRMAREIMIRSDGGIGNYQSLLDKI